MRLFTNFIIAFFSHKIIKIADRRKSVVVPFAAQFKTIDISCMFYSIKCSMIIVFGVLFLFYIISKVHIKSKVIDTFTTKS